MKKEMEEFVASQIIEVVSQSLLFITAVFVASVCYFLYVKEENSNYFLYALSFILFAFATLLELASEQSGNIVFTYGGRAVSLAAAAVLFSGISGNFSRNVFLPALLVSVYTFIAGILIPEKFFISNLPAAAASAAYLILSAGHVYRKKEFGVSRLPLASFLILWAVHGLDYPLLRYSPDVSWLGFFITTLLFSGIAFSLLIAVYESKREMLVRNAERLSSIIDNLPVVLFEFTLKPLQMRYLSRNVHTLLGYAPEKLLSRGAVWKIIEIPDRKKALQKIKAAARTGETVTLMLTVNDAAGNRRDFEAVISPSDYDSVFRGTAREVTEEHSARKRVQQFEEAISSIDIGLLLINSRNELAYFNPFAGHLLNLKRENLGEGILSLVKKSRLLAEVLAACTRTKENIFEIRFGSRVRYFRRESHILFDEHRQPEGMAIILSDVTDQEHARRELERSRVIEKVGESVATILHDFNNIFTSVVGNIEFVRTSASLSREEQEALTDAVEASRRAIEIAAELLEVSKPAGEIHYETISLEQFADEPLSLLGREEKERIKVELEADAEIRTDFSRLIRAVYNILKNAVEVSPPGKKVELRARVVNKGKKYLVISVKDCGPGMDSQTLERIFLPFYSTKTKGVGLGLYIAYSRVRDLGGRIEVNSTPGKGTEFAIEIPLEQ